ncbi:hypothetical protein [Nocardiopsis sp. L17-MgMaSL7]|uniref:hypothetical protein n=1 Tax=Nocardiopsis sp. L17-MgMaSL7 TaxID=1938893 RepID=UPI000D70AE96|nr:hypothetical protein [Nocardiopsis sp. L17-MgMaSL7]PWV45723.1 hypothetical protein BDW27_11657 [Nocardiopsis sp. L17-MgMaSL7]
MSDRTPAPGPGYESGVVTNPLLRIAGMVTGPAIMVVGTGILIVDEGAFWWPLLAVVLLAAAVGGTLVYVSSVHMRVGNGELEINAGYRSVRLRTGTVGYVGRARFEGRHARRLGRFNLTNARAGEGVEIVSRNGTYVTARTDTPDELVRALIAEGMDPSALRVPFPFESVSYRRVREIQREERTVNPA